MMRETTLKESNGLSQREMAENSAEISFESIK
jgi:hypothetical protein